MGRRILSPPPPQPLGFLGAQRERRLRCSVCLLGELISGCDPPGGCQPSRIPGRLGQHLGGCSHFGRGCCLWGLVCPSPSGSGCRPPASLPPVGYGPLCCKLALFYYLLSPFLCFPGGSDGKASAYNAGDLGSIPGSGRSPGEGNGNQLQYSFLENPMNGGDC